MARIAGFVLAAAVCAFGPAHAQDIAGMEDCTKTAGLDKRTGCFQSNIEFLQRLITKNTTDLQQKLSAANAQVGQLQRDVAGLRKNVETLQAGAAKLQTSIDQLQSTAKKPDAKDSKDTKDAK